MVKIIIFFIFFQQLLFSSFLQIDQTQLKTIEGMFGKKAVKRVQYIQDQVKQIQQEDFSYTKIYRVNSLINKLLYKKDKVHWQNERNSTFLEFVTSGAGDSLDFAVAKYVTLINLGFDKKRFQFLKTESAGLSHIKYDTKNYYVLGYSPKDTNSFVILDCYTDKIIPVYNKDIKYQATDIPLDKKLQMEEDMLKIYFVQNHEFLKVELKN